MTDALRIHLRGVDPVAQGSMRSVPARGRGSRRTPGRPRSWGRMSAAEAREALASGAARRHVVHDSAKLDDWRTAVETAARAERRVVGWEVPKGEAVAVGVTFRFAWTKEAIRQLACEGHVAILKATRPDTDKLQRAIGDALEAAGVVEDDSRIVWWPAPLRRYADVPGLDVVVQRVTSELAEEILKTSGARA